MKPTAAHPAAQTPALARPPGNLRWRIVALLFCATTINYIDRNVLSFTMIDDGFRRTMLDLPGGRPLTPADTDRFKVLMGYVDAAFKTAYALGFLLMGWFIDRVGTRRGFSWAIFIWSLAGIGNAFVGSVRGLAASRFLLGIGEAGNFPSAVKSVAEWFPKRERALATGIFNAGSNVGIIATALAVPWITLHYGWRMSFIVTGLLGLVLIGLWLWVYKRPGESRRLSRAELDYIHSDRDEEAPAAKVPWIRLLSYRQLWAVAAGKFFGDPIWWFYLTWLPDFFNSSESLEQKLDLKNIGLPFLFIYVVSDLGSIFFGWLSSRFIQRGWAVGRARKTTLFICALCVVPIVFASVTGSLWVAIGLIALATSAHQGWSANVYTISSDLFPKSTVGSVMGIAGMFGALGGVGLAAAAGVVRVQFGYVPLFVVAAGSYLVGLLVIQLLVPRWQKAELP